MKKLLIILLFCSTAYSNDSELREKSFVSDTINFVSEVLAAKNKKCSLTNRFMTTGVRDDSGFKAPRLAICKAKCAPEDKTVDDEKDWITESHYYIYLPTLYKNLEDACNKKGSNHKYDRNSITCDIEDAYGGRKEKGATELDTDISQFKSYSCDLTCWDNGEISELNFTGEPSEKAWIDWNVIKSCRGKKKVMDLNCKYD